MSKYRLHTACKVEITVGGKIKHSRLICFGLVINLYFIVHGQNVSDLNIEVARETFFHIRAGAGKPDNKRIIVSVSSICIENVPAKSLNASVKRIHTVVGCQRISGTIENESCTAYAVSVATYCASEIRMLTFVLIEVIKTKHYISERIIFIGKCYISEDSTIVGDLNSHSAFTG